MFSLLVKEINSFLNSLIGYIVIIVFLLTISLFVWVFPGTEFNIPDAGYASIDPLFIITPWVYMFLVPAVTMRLFSEEKKSGTIEILLTRPLTELQVVVAKYLAGVVLVLFSLLPTLIYFFSVYTLGSPAGNIDTGSMWGSYVGLFFLGAGFVSIGVFSSAVSDNQVIAFIIAVFLCFFWYAGFDSISSLIGSGAIANVIYQAGINAHYSSMSRGVIDTRDVIYFISLVSLFIMLTRTILESRKW
ncbi:MAG: gliding motility-associated ABC transporter permease subunit GldF [Bacteroidetes bacterium]|nr:gliding motility-associated ABC transporter permease subunit GldF [Bacteroidota bacterium]MBK7388018.1 gliding motility-associated ABC transporter permease subunit GldF [Bacteroidota bacterium]MBK8413473.1 gliding motility-associated ABC transporter permease subunit GldF [Bacteroidota bacterium]MBK8876779.1 gliding motility-associated ABC transporter permease subunit GldF [Bacteroidota bacterium]MBK9046378.1 gliding motility-associated ABC transporter permease subunit GldF [Bacteroidota bact